MKVSLWTMSILYAGRIGIFIFSCGFSYRERPEMQ